MRYEAIIDIEQKISIRDYQNPCAYIHFHRGIEMLYVKSGKLSVRIFEQIYTAEKDEILFIPSYFPHSVQTEQPSLTTVFILSYKFFKDLEKQGINLNYSLLDNKEINRKIYRYIELLDAEPDREADILTFGYVSVIFGLIVRNYTPHEEYSLRKNNFAEQIVSYIENHYREDITLDKLASKYNFNKFYFSKLFNKIFGCSLRYYINNVRINHILTDESDKTMTERILDAGFKDISTFYKYKKNLYKFQ